ncbi:MAG: TetR/AcrR family transcriptional regulator [Bifidobacteriaceae bacterium]|jgi:AcrR family transcriptional regulator|nr:TetR/AcrR family transcriptional regulator [Bifidobacteriaceae bacterium]
MPPDTASTEPVLTQGRPPRGYAKGRAKRQQIVEVAMEVFGESGYDASSMMEIAERCGLSRAGLWHHFPSKESILEAVLAWRDQVDHESFRARGSSQGGLAVLRGMVELARDNAKVPRLIGLYAILSAEAASPGHPAHTYFQARYQRIVEGTEKALAQIGASGGLAPGVDPHEAAVNLVALTDGLQVQWLLSGGVLDMAGHLRSAAQAILTVDF